MIIKVRETTLGNNKYNLGKRQRQYYVLQEFYLEPRKIGRIVYTYEPRSWFMKWNETPEDFFARIYAKRDGKRIHLPPIPDIYRDKIEAKVKVAASKKNRGIYTIEDSEPITKPAAKKGRKKKVSIKEMDEQKRLLEEAGVNKKGIKEIRGREIKTKVEDVVIDESEGEGEGEGEIEEIIVKNVDKKRPQSEPIKPVKIATSKPTLKRIQSERPRNTLVVIRDNDFYDTGIRLAQSDNKLLDQILKQKDPVYSEILASILDTANQIKGWDYSDLIDEKVNMLRVDPDGTGLDSYILTDIINAIKPENESIVDFLQNIDVKGYKGPGTYNTNESSGRGRDNGRDSDSDSDSDLQRFAGEEGQKYLSGVLSRLSSAKK